MNIVDKGLKYEINPSTKEAILIGAESKYIEHLKVPCSIKYDNVKYTVVKIANNAFEKYTSLIDVVLGVNGGFKCKIKSIGNEAFRGCFNLEKVEFESEYSVSTLEVIGDSAFFDCNSLQDIEIPDSVTSIGYCAFCYCKLNNIIIPNSVTSIGVCAFGCCYSLGSAILPDSVKIISKNIFERCIRLTKVSLGNSVTSIGDYAFKKCENLANITIPDTVTSIGEEAFDGCISLRVVKIPDSVTSIEDNAFDEKTEVIKAKANNIKTFSQRSSK